MREAQSIEFETDLTPTKDEIRSKIEFELKKKGIENAEITYIAHPEKIY